MRKNYVMASIELNSITLNLGLCMTDRAKNESEKC